MTNKERIYTLDAVIRTMDNRLFISGLENMEVVIGCTQAIQSVINDLKEQPEEPQE